LLRYAWRRTDILNAAILSLAAVCRLLDAHLVSLRLTYLLYVFLSTAYAKGNALPSGFAVWADRMLTVLRRDDRMVPFSPEAGPGSSPGSKCSAERRAWRRRAD
jgi:hypothetical protein